MKIEYKEKIHLKMLQEGTKTVETLAAAGLKDGVITN